MESNWHLHIVFIASHQQLILVFIIIFVGSLCFFILSCKFQALIILFVPSEYVSYWYIFKQIELWWTKRRNLFLNLQFKGNKEKCPGNRLFSTFPNLKYFAKFVCQTLNTLGYPSFIKKIGYFYHYIIVSTSSCGLFLMLGLQRQTLTCRGAHGRARCLEFRLTTFPPRTPQLAHSSHPRCLTQTKKRRSLKSKFWVCILTFKGYMTKRWLKFSSESWSFSFLWNS